MQSADTYKYYCITHEHAIQVGRIVKGCEQRFYFNGLIINFVTQRFDHRQ